LAGAVEIIIERLSENADLRSTTRTRYMHDGFTKTAKGEKAKSPSKFENYFTYEERVRDLMKPESSHRYLAMRRGWMEEELTLHLGGPTPPEPADACGQATCWGPGGSRWPKSCCTCSRPPLAACRTFRRRAALKKAARFALRAHVVPAIENEVHKALREVADEAAIHVFAENVRKLLLSAPFGPKAVLGVDPGLRTGCKLAVVDDSGKVRGQHGRAPGIGGRKDRGSTPCLPSWSRKAASAPSRSATARPAARPRPSSATPWTAPG
jgi:uncharacterized protein